MAGYTSTNQLSRMPLISVDHHPEVLVLFPSPPLPVSYLYWASLVAQMVKRPPTMRETQVRSLGREDSLEKEIATHASVLAWKIPWTKEPAGLQSMGLQRVGHD